MKKDEFLKKVLETISRCELYSYYIEANHTKAETAKQFNVSVYTLENLLKHYDIVKPKSDIVARRKETCLKKYGVDNPSKCSEVINKIIDTNIDKYGAKSFTATEEGKKQISKTKEQRYGDPHYNNMNKNQQTKLENHGDKNYNNRDKAAKTFLEHYGVDNYFKTSELKELNKERLFQQQNYSTLFRELFDNIDQAKHYLESNNKSAFELAKEFNCPVYTVYAWALSRGLSAYIERKYTGTSHYEDEITEFLNSFNVSVQRNVRNVLDNCEIDIYIPEFHLGIEFNGDYWHSSMFKDKYYHENKSKEAESKGIRLIHIYEYEWTNPATKLKIMSLLTIAMNKVTRRIYARQCDIRQITNKQASILNNSVHLQGHRDAAITYGLYYQEELVQLMSFSKHRKYDWEIIRGCPGSNNIVVGGVSKLFKHFVKMHEPDSIFSYCDYNKFDGRSYEALGMKFIGLTGPDLSYIIDGKVYKRRPDKYKEYKKTAEALLYGAGSKKYLWTNQLQK